MEHGGEVGHVHPREDGVDVGRHVALLEEGSPQGRALRPLGHLPGGVRTVAEAGTSAVAMERVLTVPQF